jgi:trehalose 6-phosphate phosphatase
MGQSAALGAPPPLDELAAAGPIALFLDFDGTLVEIAPTPDSIVVPEGLNVGLEQLAERLEGRLALVSGRSAADLEQHIGPPGVARAGSHGIERIGIGGAPIGPSPAPLPRIIEDEVRKFVRNHAGMTYEQKSHGAAIHFRAVPELEDVAIGFAEELAVEQGMWAKLGKCIVEIVHQGADKGAAVRAFMAEEPFAGARPIFVGDDVTDEDGIIAATQFGGFGVIVGERADSVARFHLSQPQEVHRWLGL